MTKWKLFPFFFFLAVNKGKRRQQKREFKQGMKSVHSMKLRARKWDVYESFWCCCLYSQLADNERTDRWQNLLKKRSLSSICWWWRWMAVMVWWAMVGGDWRWLDGDWCDSRWWWWILVLVLMIWWNCVTCGGCVIMCLRERLFLRRGQCKSTNEKVIFFSCNE